MDRIGLLVELMGNEKALRSLRKLKEMRDSLANKNVQMRLDTYKMERELNDIRKDIRDLTRYKKTIPFDSPDLQKTLALIEELKKRRDELLHDKGDISLDIKYNNEGLRAVKSEIQEIERDARSARDVLGSMGSAFSSIGGGLERIGGVFSSNIFDYAKQFLTWGITDKVINNWQDAANRFDILNTYEPYMAIMGISSKQAQDSLAKINEEIQGLPIGLDEAAFQTRRYAMFLGADAEKATDLVIGLNKALIAGGAPEQMRNYATYEIERLLATGKLATARQWMSLLNGLGVSTVFLKDALGRTDMTLNEFVKDVSSSDDSTITAQEFLEGVMSLADDKEMNKAIDIYKGTIESGMSNIQFAITRGKANIYSALNDMFMETEGMNISDYLYEGRDLLNRAFEGITDWIRDNPEAISAAMDRIDDLFIRLEQFDWVSLGESILGSVEKLFDIVEWIYDNIPQEAIIGFITFSTVWASPLGKAFSLLGTLFSGLSRLPVFNFGFLTKGIAGAGKFFTTFKEIGKGFVGASAFIGIIAEVGAVIWEFTKVAETISTADLSGLDRNLKPAINFFANGGALATILTGIFSLIGSNPVAAGAVGVGELLAGGFVTIIGEIGAVIGEFTSVASQIATAKLPTDAKMKRIGEVFQSFGELFGTEAGTIRINKYKIKQLNRAIELVQSIADALPAFDQISAANIDTESVVNTMSSIVDVMSEINILMSQDFWASDAWRTKQNAKIVTNMSDLVTSVSDVIDSLVSVRQKLKDAGFYKKKGKKGEKSLARLTETIKSLLEDMQDISTAINENSGIFATLKDDIVTKIKTDIIQNYTEAMDAVGELSETLTDTRGKLYEARMNMNGEEMSQKIGDLLDKVKESLASVDTKLLAISAEIEASKWEDYAEKITHYKEIIQNIIDMAHTILMSRNEISWASADGNGGGGEAMTSLGTFIENLKTLASGISGLGDMSENIQRVADLRTCIEDIRILALDLQAMQETLETLNAEGSAISQLQTMLNSLTTVLTGGDVGEAVGNFDAMATAVSTLQTALSNLSSVDLAPLVESLGQAKEATKKLEKALSSLGEQAEAAGDNAIYLETCIEELASTAQSKASSFDTFISSLSSIAGVAGTAASNVSSLASAMASLQSRSVSLTVNTPGLSSAISGMRTLRTLSGSSGNANSRRAGIGRYSTGGRVAYLARGGALFKPKGTDTVPAMLTPGEWVINRRASQLFGDAFMDKVNKLDIPGAMDALMSHSRYMPCNTINRTTNNYDNHAVVNQYFPNRKDSKSSYRMASRFIYAL